MLAAISTEDLSRWLLAAICVVSGVQAIRLSHASHGIYAPHFYFIAGWSFIFGAGMAELASPDVIPIPAAFLIEWINTAAMCTLAGWMSLVWRLRRERRRT